MGCPAGFGLEAVVEVRDSEGVAEDVFDAGEPVVLFAGVRNHSVHSTTLESRNSCLVGDWTLESTDGREIVAPIVCATAVTPFRFPPDEVVGRTWDWDVAEEGDWTLTVTFGTPEPPPTTIEFTVIPSPGR